MSISGVGSGSQAAQPPADVQQAVAIKALKTANEQAASALTLIEGAAQTADQAQAINADGSVDLLA